MQPVTESRASITSVQNSLTGGGEGKLPTGVTLGVSGVWRTECGRNPVSTVALVDKVVSHESKG